MLTLALALSLASATQAEPLAADTPAADAQTPAAEASAPATPPTPASPSEEGLHVALQGVVASGLGVSSWSGDRALYGTAAAGLCLGDVLVLQARVRTGYATVDDRQLTALMFGLLLRWPMGEWRPYVRGALLHQHEESLAAIGDNPLNAVFGVGPGIRHRYGAEGALGVDRAVWRDERAHLFLGGELFADAITYSSGPPLSLGVLAVAAFEYDL